MNRATALIELGSSHDECLYSQAAFLADASHEVHLVVSPDLEARVSGWDCVAGLHILDSSGGEWGALRTAWRLRALLDAIGADTAVFNTAQGAVVRDFTLLPQGGRRLAGVLHNIHKLRDSRGQRLISRRIKRYLVLNDYLLENRDDRLDLTLGWFYPIFFPQVEGVPVDKQPGEFWAAVPGKIDFQRRDYRGLLQGMVDTELPANLKFLMLGPYENDDVRREVQELAATTGQPGRFRFFDGFVENATLQSYLKASDLVLTLLHPGTERFGEYSRIQITGSFNLAYGHKVPLLMENFFARYRAFVGNSIFYGKDDLVPTLARLAADPGPIAPLKAAMAEDPRLTFEYQRDQYLAVVDGST